MPLDPRINAWRSDLAARALEGEVESARFVDGTLFQVTAGVCPVRKSSAYEAEQLSQALHGDAVTIFEEVDGFGWGQMASDSYVGWFDMEALSSPRLVPTHRVCALRTYVFSEPSIKSAPVCLLSVNSEIVAEATQAAFIKAARLGWVVSRHLGALDEFETDPATVAERFLGAPYLWGGKESLGLDCSGLIQMALVRCGIVCPRDSDMQRTLGHAVEPSDVPNNLQRNDIVCWKGHVGIMLDAERLLHANAFHMQTAIEPLSVAIARITPLSGPIITVRRL